jgi:Ca2+-binding EF-hand superfamily protein
MDPEQKWLEYVQMTGGTDTIKLENIPPDRRQKLQFFTEKLGVPPMPASGEWNKQQFMEYQTQLQQTMQTKFGAPGGGPPGFVPPPGAIRPSKTSSPEDLARRFAEYDVNKDGKLSMEEVARSSSTRAMFKDFDKNGDGYLDLEEYTSLRQSRENGGAPPGTPPPASTDPNTAAMSSTYPGGPTPPNVGRDDRRDRKDEDAKPVAIRYGKQPKEAPTWFTELDTDKDGQIGLYEWRKAGRPMSEFAEMDLNNDGFITAEEWLRFQRLTQENARNAELVSAATEGDAASTSTSATSTPSSTSSRPSRSGSRGSWGGSTRGPWGGAPSASSSATDKSDKADKKDEKRDEPPMRMKSRKR